MKTLLGPKIIVAHPTRPRTWIFVPGDWEVQVPLVHSPEASDELVQACFESGYMRGLRDAIARRACDYAKRFPELAEPHSVPRTSKRYVTLRGFDASALQHTYVPFERVGSHGKEAYLPEIISMGERALALTEKGADVDEIETEEASQQSELAGVRAVRISRELIEDFNTYD